MRFTAGKWVDDEGRPVELQEPPLVFHGESGPAEDERPDPRETTTKGSHKADPRKAKGAQ